MTEPLTFADFLPDDRSEERKRCDALREVIRAHMRSGEASRWVGWQQLFAAHRGTTEIERALFDLALRKELVASRDDAPPKPVLGLIFTEMGWWQADGPYQKRNDELRNMREAFGIGHLRPVSTRPKAPDAMPAAPETPALVWWIIAGVVLFVILMG